MNPVVIIASIAGSACAVFYYSLFNIGLTGPASPGSIIAFLTMAPKGSTLAVLLGVVIAAVVSFLVAAPIIKMSNGKSLEEASDSVQNMKAASKGIAKRQERSRRSYSPATQVWVPVPWEQPNSETGLSRLGLASQ